MTTDRQWCQNGCPALLWIEQRCRYCLGRRTRMSEKDRIGDATLYLGNCMEIMQSLQG